jgi:hypothetical protein
MRRTIVGGLVGGLLAGAALVTAAPAIAAAPATAAPALEVRLSTQPVRLTPSGRVPLAFRVRCAPGVQAHELDASVKQATAYGSVTLAAPPFVATCDGTWHRVVVKVAPGSAAFRVGKAEWTVGVFGYVPPPSDGDVGAGAGGTLWVGPRR